MGIKIKNLPEKYAVIWGKALPYLEKGRPGDDRHAAEVVELVLGYTGKVIDKDVLVPTAMMHDIGHCAILPDHFKFVTGPEKLINGKLAHMLTGAKIASDILEEVGYPKDKAKEIIDIITVHDADQLKGISMEKWFDTENKKVFHDLDSMDRYTEARIKSFEKLYPVKEKLIQVLEESLNSFFYDEFRDLAKDRLTKLTKK